MRLLQLSAVVFVASCIGEIPELRQTETRQTDGGYAGGSEARGGGAGGQVDSGDIDAGATNSDAGIDAGVAHDAGVDAGNPGRPCKSLLVCDDFESNTVGSAPKGWGVNLWSGSPVVGTANVVQVDNTRAFSGSKSIHIVSNAAIDHGSAQISRDVSFKPNAFFGRMRLWLKRINTTDHRHWNLIEGWGYRRDATGRTVADQAMYEYGGGGGDSKLDALYLADGKDCCEKCGSGPAPLPLNQWACVEWQFDGVNDEMRFWVDGKSIDALTVTDPWCKAPWTAPVFEKIRLGFENAKPEASGPMEMWMDDVAFDHQRVGCEP